MTSARALLNLLSEIDRTCIQAVSDNGKVLVALDRDMLDRLWQIAHNERKREREDEHRDND